MIIDLTVGPQFAWIGLMRSTGDPNYSWTDGTPVIFDFHLHFIIFLQFGYANWGVTPQMTGTWCVGVSNSFLEKDLPYF